MVLDSLMSLNKKYDAIIVAVNHDDFIDLNEEYFKKLSVAKKRNLD